MGVAERFVIMKKFVSCLIGIALCSSPIIVHADETCPDVLNKCDKALHAEIDLNTAKQGVIDEQANLINVLKVDLDKESLWKPIAIGAGTAAIVEGLILILRK